MGAAMGFLRLSALARANPDKAIPLAEEDAFKVSHALNPDAEVIIIQSLTGGLLYSRVESQRYPNVRRVASLRTIV